MVFFNRHCSLEHIQTKRNAFPPKLRLSVLYAVERVSEKTKNIFSCHFFSNHRWRAPIHFSALPQRVVSDFSNLDFSKSRDAMTGAPVSFDSMETLVPKGMHQGVVLTCTLLYLLIKIDVLYLMIAAVRHC